MEVLKVSAKSVPNSVAGAIAGVIRDSGSVEVQAVGAGATNQAVKAIADRQEGIWRRREWIWFVFQPLETSSSITKRGRRFG